MANNFFKKLLPAFLSFPEAKADERAVTTPETQNQTPETEQRSVGISDTAGMMRILNIATEGGVPNVTPDTILTLPAVVRATEIVCGALAKMSVTVYRKQGGKVITLENHPAHYLSNNSPDGQLTPFRFWWNMWANAYLSGGGGAEIIRNANGKPIALRLMRLGCTPYQTWHTDPLRYWDNEDGRLFDAEDVLYIPGLMVRSGKTVSTLSQAFRNDFGEQLAQTMLSMTLFKQGVYPAAVYGYTGTKASASGDQKIADDISMYFGGLDRAGKVIPIANMDKFTQLKQHSFVDSDMLNMRKWGLNAVALMFGIPADMLGNSEKQSYAYSETSAKNFVLYTLDPKLTERDQEIKMKLVSTTEQATVQVETMVDETLWMLPKDRVEYWNKLHQMGAINADQIRAYLNQNPVEDGSGSTYYVQSQLIPTDLIKEFWTSKKTTTSEGTQPKAAERAKLNGHEHHTEN